VQSISTRPWLLLPALLVVVIVVAFQFLGDGLRDAADPYR
jgi:peptide/nickel transport system permease protein